MEKVLGAELSQRIRRARVLVVGAGGIGCELLKNLALAGFGTAPTTSTTTSPKTKEKTKENDEEEKMEERERLEVIDVDTIDVSNLNRQFLFQARHVGKPKSVVAAEALRAFNPLVRIRAHHASVTDHQFGVEYFRSFDLVMNALDNLAARRHVNRMCLAARVPLVESGTGGYYGQVTMICKGQTECFECQPKATPKTFPVCTIRSTPSAPIHCIVWAKDYLFAQLFGNVDEEEVAGADGESESESSENAQELRLLKKEAEALQTLRANMLEKDFGAMVFDKVFHRDIVRLQSMTDMWKSRRAPVPLSLESVSAAEGNGDVTSTSSASSSVPLLADQRLWTLRECVDVFMSSIAALARHMHLHGEQLTFDKDDEEMLNFVASVANIRAHIFGIERQTRFRVKEMAGNIIPAIATTNAVIAGLMVLEAFAILDSDEATSSYVSDPRLSTTYLQYGRSDKLLMHERLRPPNPECYVCSNKNVSLRLDLSMTLRVFVEEVLKKSLSLTQPTVLEGARLLYDVDEEDNLDRTLEDLGIRNETLVTVDDEMQDYKLVVHMIHGQPKPLKDGEAPPLFEVVRSDSTSADKGDGADVVLLRQRKRKRPNEDDDEDDDNDQPEIL